MNETNRTTLVDISLRRAAAADETFLETVYAETRRDELFLLGWTREQENAFFKMQFRLQNQSYKMQFPAAQYYVIESKKMPIGNLIVERDAEIRLINIALLLEFRRCGIGTILLEHLQTEAAEANKTLTLSVLQTNNQAVSLYHRCGFTIIDKNELYLTMRWQSL